MMSTSQRPPSLQLLPAFEAAARHLSFSKAALELHLTTSAISQQIKQLEAQLGMPLFRRLARRVELTEAGQQFLAVASKTLNAYRHGHASFVERFARPELRLSMTPLIAHEFIMPRIDDFRATHPDVSLSIEGSMNLIDFDREAIDAAIRVGSGQWSGLKSWLLCDLEAVALASPAVLQRQPIHHFADLGNHTLIRRRHEHFGWAELARLMKASDIAGKADLMVDTDLAALHAAERGLGVALSFLPANTNLSSVWPDRLIAALPPVPTPLKAFFVFRSSSDKGRLLKDAFEWVREQVAPERRIHG